MIFSHLEFMSRAGIDQQTLDVWIEEEWVVPQGALELPEFTEADVARARLILDLMRDLGVNAEGVGVALHLIDQVHDMRQVLAALIDQMRLSRG
jgi:chaperone modulatory protein CbpM